MAENTTTPGNGGKVTHLVIDNNDYTLSIAELPGKIANEGSTVSADHSIAVGSEATASGSASQAFGDQTEAVGQNSHAEGTYSRAEGMASHAEGGCTNVDKSTTIQTSSNGKFPEYGTYAQGNYSHAEGQKTWAAGEASHSEGKNTLASGVSSHAEGYKTEALGECSHAEGATTIASGNNSHAEGTGTKAQKESSHAEGNSTVADGASSHAEGSGTKAEGNDSHAEGYWTEAKGAYSHAEGGSTEAAGDASHAEGFDTAASSDGSHAEGYYTVASGIASHAEGGGPDDITKQVTRTIAGVNHHVRGSTAVGNYSHAEGYQTFAGGASSHAEGVQTQALGNCSHASGEGTIAKGDHQFVIGKYNIEDDTQAFIIGNGDSSARSNACTINHKGTIISKSEDESIFEQLRVNKTLNVGNSLSIQTYDDISQNILSFKGMISASGFSEDKTVLGDFPLSLIIGAYTKQTVGEGDSQQEVIKGETFNYLGSDGNEPLNYAPGYRSHAEGGAMAKDGSDWEFTPAENVTIEGTLAAGDYSHTEGSQTYAKGVASHAEGYRNQAIGNYSHAEGFNTIASGVSSHAEGQRISASDTEYFGEGATGNYSHSEGYMTTAAGEASHAEGKGTKTSNDVAHAEGFYTIASGDCSHAEGVRTEARGQASHAEGYSSSYDGEEKSFDSWKDALYIDEDINTRDAFAIALGDNSHIEGKDSLAIGDCSHAGGLFCVAEGNYSQAEGHMTWAKGQYSTAVGSGTTAWGSCSSAEGGCKTPLWRQIMRASDETERAKGNNLEEWRANFTDAEKKAWIHTNYGRYDKDTSNPKYYTCAYGAGSHAGGESSLAMGDYSFAHGESTYTLHACSTAIGKWNSPTRNSGKSNLIFSVGNGTREGGRSNAFSIDYYGHYYSQGGYSDPGDYAEYFEWVDENPSKEDRIGMVVCLNNDKIEFANSSNDVLGIVSGTPVLVGDCAHSHWCEKFLTDKFGRPIYETIVNKYGEEEKIQKINPNYDPKKEYIPRDSRPEWACVGLIGKIFARDDGTCKPNCYAKPVNGILTHSDERTSIRVMKRTDKDVVRVFIK